ncbi:GNAT family N-acetyltransferase [Salibacterium aidingense]|uniref:GNAT family N-acetyltransferase n=1 Tax=Salibacterium aidingense TaxID=384933 RepID=UPI003BE45015
MSNKSLIQKLEELSMNALPALETQVNNGWKLRFSNGYTKRANSIYPLYAGDGGLKRRIAESEQSYRDRKLRTVYKMTEQVHPRNLDDVLEKSNYLLAGKTSVQMLLLSEIHEKPPTNAEMYTELNEKWFSYFCHFNNVRETHQNTLKQMLHKINPTTCFVLLINNSGAVLSCGLGVLEEEYIGLFDIVTNDKYRNMGYGTELINSLLNWGRENGAKYAYLQVVLDNIPALNLYSKLGIRERYKYWYRIKEE